MSEPREAASADERWLSPTTPRQLALVGRRGLAVAVFALAGCGNTAAPPLTCMPNDPNPNCAVYDCHMAPTCDATCAAGTPCGKLDCSDAAQCRLDCQPNEVCPVDCRRTGTCFIDCEEGSMCDVDCTASQDCTVHCHLGAACLIDCGGATSCLFDACTGGTVTQCPNGVTVCNRACP